MIDENHQARGSDIERIWGYDLLRGICAIGVACYHILSWSGVTHMYSIGTYGVYIFFVLSGASMCAAYADRFSHGYPVPKFLLARFLRLAPLLTLVIALSAMHMVRQPNFGWSAIGQIFLNVFLLFGFGNPGATSIIVGGWSLGIEFQFYVCFLVFLALARMRRAIWLLGLTFIAQHVFISQVLSAPGSFESKWPSYIQFLSFIFYFFAGCVIGCTLQKHLHKLKHLALPAMILCLAIISLSSGEKEEASLMGPTGIFLSLLATASVAAAKLIPIRGFMTNVSRVFGKMSYGLYLLHPLVNGLVMKVTPTISTSYPALHLIVVVSVSAILAIAIDHWYETPIRRFAAKRFAPHFKGRVA